MQVDEESLSMGRPFRESLDKLGRRVLARITAEEEASRLAKKAENDRHIEKCRRRAIFETLVGQLGTRYAPQRVELANYSIYDPRQTGVVARIRAIGERISEFVEQGRNLALFGTVGTGKDHLLAWLLYRAASEGLQCRFAEADYVRRVGKVAGAEA